MKMILFNSLFLTLVANAGTFSKLTCSGYSGDKTEIKYKNKWFSEDLIETPLHAFVVNDNLSEEKGYFVGRIVSGCDLLGIDECKYKSFIPENSLSNSFYLFRDYKNGLLRTYQFMLFIEKSLYLGQSTEGMVVYVNDRVGRLTTYIYKCVLAE